MRETIRIPAQVQRIAVPLIDQQMWCWGCDVRRPAGNLLLAYNAEKRPLPNPRHPSAYIFQTHSEAAVTLWGWGVWIACAKQGSLFVSRSCFRVSYSASVIRTPDAWQKRDLPAMRGIQDETQTVHCSDLLKAALNWIGGYESWLSRQVETDYRERVLEAWPQRRRHRGGVPPTEMAERWFDLSTTIEEIIV